MTEWAAVVLVVHEDEVDEVSGLVWDLGVSGVEELALANQAAMAAASRNDPTGPDAAREERQPREPRGEGRRERGGRRNDRRDGAPGAEDSNATFADGRKHCIAETLVKVLGAFAGIFEELDGVGISIRGAGYASRQGKQRCHECKCIAEFHG